MTDGEPVDGSLLFVGDADGPLAAIATEAVEVCSIVDAAAADWLDTAAARVVEESIDAIAFDDRALNRAAEVEPPTELVEMPSLALLERPADDPFTVANHLGVDELLPLADLDEPIPQLAGRLRRHLDQERRRRGAQLLSHEVRQLVDYADDVVWIFSPEWDELLYSNPAYERIWGRSLKEAYANPRSFLGGVHPTDRPMVRRAMERLTAGDEIELEFRVNRQEDYGRWVWVKGYPIEDDEGVIAVSGFARDISDRKVQEQRYRRERDRFLNLFEHFPEPTIAYTFEGDTSRVAAVNEAFTSLFGYAPEEAIGADVDELVAPEDRREEAAAIDQRVRAGEFVDDVVRRSTADGERYFRFRNIELDEDDEYHGFAIYADVDAQIRREETLSALHAISRELARAERHDTVAEIAVEAAEQLLEAELVGIWLGEPDAGELAAVHLTEALCDRLPPGPTLGRDESIIETALADDGYHVDDTTDVVWPPALEAIGSALVLPLGDRGVLLIGTADTGGLRDEDRSFARVLAANTLAAIERADREVTLREQRRELRRQNDRLEEFSGVVSHDLRTPLAVATAATDHLADEHDLDATQVQEALARMDNIISKTLTLAKSGRVTGETEPVDLDQLARNCRHVVPDANTAVHVEDGLPVVDGDGDRLKHVFENLYRNALDHGGPDVTVTVRPVEGGFAIDDDGPGIPPGERDSVLETGYSTAQSGTGLGLAIVRRIAEAHGWEIVVEESPAGGARFRFDHVAERGRPSPR